MIEEKKGDWYSTHLSATSLHGIQGYKVFIAIAMMLENGGVIAELASYGLMMSILDRTSGLMGDFKVVFWIFNSAYRLGDPEGSYPALYALMYREIALLRVEGFGTLPKHCLNLSICFILAAIQINLVTQLLKKFETKYRIY
ncbi:hypothetical protein H5410_001712 [Solanum commersonii]|uniref:Uncharacterized protein n=1 Tax=Solanum commersonii TaxID=4109 RepID=A0A9J6B0D5_SOLCO|nr:hypothetical protein H5410_001712 [Solanum commersonii]